MKRRRTLLRSAMSRIFASASTSVMDWGRSSGSRVRIEAGTIASVNVSSDSWPTTRSICATSASLGPMWRSMNASWCSSERREVCWVMSGLWTWAGLGLRRGRRWGAPLSFCLRVQSAGEGCASCPFGAGVNRSLQSVHTRRFGGLSDYGRCAFGSGPGPASPTGGLQPPDYRPSGHASPGYLGRSCKSKGPRRSGVPGGACSAAVAVRVAGQRTLDAMPGGAGRLAGVLPLQPRITAVARLVVAAQLRLDLVEVAPLVPRPRLVAGTVGRAVVLVGVVRLDVGLVAVVLLPVLVLRGWVHAFGHALAGEAAGDGAHGRSHGGTDRAG